MPRIALKSNKVLRNRLFDAPAFWNAGLIITRFVRQHSRVTAAIEFGMLHLNRASKRYALILDWKLAMKETSNRQWMYYPNISCNI